ncbi:pentatricopeptide repeat-containing At2g33680 [Olea europaea subsp. europaea]|uniref:Pentatricopeptide repeat-containing At2g33680 n=1 Tax=Olea europaea subsp. europaea TaxID=158383 RepID=A0A8S0R7U2_OLEEU|nr:pentatricopeptide repeat-containing At2g33680 [Olea europaea subsp. europaea]
MNYSPVLTAKSRHLFAKLLDYTQGKNLPKGKSLHAHLLKTGVFPSCPFMSNTLVNFYAKCHLFSEAHLAFVQISYKDTVSWNCLINAYSQLSLRCYSLSALELFKQMLQHHTLPNSHTFAGILSSAAMLEDSMIAQQAHSFVLKLVDSYDVFVYSSLLNVYCKLGDLISGQKVFDEMAEKNSVTWATMISGYASQRLTKEAFSVFRMMTAGGGEGVNEFVLTSLLSALVSSEFVDTGKQVHSLAVKTGLLSIVSVGNAVLTMYAKCDSLDDAVQAFELAIAKNSITWSAMITGYAQGGIAPNELTIASVLKACSSLSALEQGKQVHAHVVKNGFSLEVPIGSSLSTMYAKCGSLDDGNLIFTRMPARDVASWNAMISGLSQNGLGIKALELFEEMQLEGARPDYVTFVNILSACSHMGLVDRGWEYFKLMSDKFGEAPRIEHHACMVDILGRAGKLYEATEFIESATIEHGLCLWRILLSACRNHRNYELGAYAGEKLMELGSQESSAYVLLSSIYTALGRLHDVERVRRIMNLRGISKEPGCSWIELKSQVHVFVVGDQLHPQIQDVRSGLWRLSKLMKDEECSSILEELV